MKKIFLMFLVFSLTFLNACTEPTQNNEVTLTQFEAQLSVDSDFLIGKLCYTSAEEIVLMVDYPEEIKDLEFHQNTFGITVSFDETEITEFQSELFGFNLAPVEELFEYLSALGKDNFITDKSGDFQIETIYDNITGKFDLTENRIISIKSENHDFDFIVK